MKIKEGFMLREIAGEYIVVPVGRAAVDFNGIITLNGTGAFLWKQLKTNQSIDDLSNALGKEYKVKREVAFKDIRDFIDTLKKASLLEE
ncbi:MAG: PqqD family protein [Bacilli bacterium]|jgi:hypothetical protein|nr:PqqD family protein [Bacilli bacterium]